MVPNVETQDDNAEPPQCQNAWLARVTGASTFREIELDTSSIDHYADRLLLKAARCVRLGESAIYQAPVNLAFVFFICFSVFGAQQRRT